MFGRAAQLFVVLNYLVAVALAIYNPVAPLQGDYTWELVLSDKNGPESFTGGRTMFDFVSGYVRMESWNTPDANPGINGVTLWDLRENQPIVNTIDENANCWVEKLDSNVSAPTPLDWTGYQFINVSYFNRALAELWGDGYGGVVYVDVFSRDVVGMGNTSLQDGTSIFYTITSWSDKKPDGTNFLLPNTIQCKQINALESYGTAVRQSQAIHPQAALIDLKCEGCKLAIGLIIGRLCNGIGAMLIGAAACAPFPPSIPFCAVLAALACKFGVGKLTKEKACRVIRLC